MSEVNDTTTTEHSLERQKRDFNLRKTKQQYKTTNMYFTKYKQAEAYSWTIHLGQQTSHSHGDSFRNVSSAGKKGEGG